MTLLSWMVLRLPLSLIVRFCALAWMLRGLGMKLLLRHRLRLGRLRSWTRCRHVWRRRSCMSTVLSGKGCEWSET
jgi:hypothetical protein